MSALKHFELITIEQYEALPEDAHTEVFEGIPYNMASPSQEHQTISMELSTTINNYMKKRQGSCRVFCAPFDVKLSDSPLTIVQPDLMVICNPENSMENAVTVRLILSLKSSPREIPPTITSVNFTIIKMPVYAKTGL